MPTAALMLALLVAACATRPQESPVVRDVTPVGAVSLFDGAQNPADVKLDIAARDNLDILALSGGGANGAFGAGVLAGWSRQGTRPRFDIVTGVSTGALMSVLAFLGPEQDDLLKQVYTMTSNKDIYVAKGAFGLFGDSMLDYAPLKLEIEEIVTPALLARVAEEHNKGRRLYVATTNLDAGELVVWDMGFIAASGHPAALRVFQKVLRASAAVPGFFKPVYIQPLAGNKARQMHVDGGVKAPILVRGFMFTTPAKHRTLHVIINGQMKLSTAERAVQPKVMDISRRSISELLRGLTYKTVYQSYVAARHARADFSLITIPDQYPVSDDALEFDPKKMGDLYEAGYQLGLANTAWENEPPRLEQLERVRSDQRVAGKRGSRRKKH